MQKKTKTASITFVFPWVPYSDFGTMVVYCGVLALLETMFRAI